MPTASLESSYDHIHGEAVRLAGGLADLAQRATVYHHIYRAARGNHVFPLIAAHGALWAGGYFRMAMRVARGLAWQYPFTAQRRQACLGQLQAFADAFRDINRRVCVDVYTHFHFTARHGDDPRAAEFVPGPLLAALRRVHAAIHAGNELHDDERREVFRAHFLHEQEHIVGPAIAQAVAAFDWPLVRSLALRPPVRFAYFPGTRRLWFRNFANREERIARGLQAFEMAAELGWQAVEEALDGYGVLPAAFFIDPPAYFAAVRSATLALA